MKTERFEVRMTTKALACFRGLAAEEKVSISEMLVRAACRAVNFDENEAIPEKQLPGRKPKVRR